MQGCEVQLEQLAQAACAKTPAPAATAALTLLQSLSLQLGPCAANPGEEALPAWWLTDDEGCALDLRAPLLAQASAGRGIALALWAPVPGGWQCLRRAHWACGSTWAEVQALLPRALAQLLWQAALAQQLGAAAAGPLQARPGPAADAAPCKPLPAAPLPWLRLRGLLRAWCSRQHARWWREQWRLGVLPCSADELVSASALPAPQWFEPCAGLGYWADPAAQAGADNTDSDSRILAEFFDEALGRGVIEELQLDEAGRVRQRTEMALGGGRHASFAHVVRAGGRQIGLAETAALQSCELHEVDAQGRWHRIATVLQGLALADPTLFHWQGRWWLAATDLATGAFDNLCLFHAAQPEGPWQPHLNNPVKLDLRGARMAGAFFWHEGQLYRPAQDCGATYGAAVALYQVLHCSPQHYEERLVRRITPDPQGPCPDGLHTLNPWGRRMLIDGKRHVFSPALGWLKLRRRLGLAGARA